MKTDHILFIIFILAVSAAIGLLTDSILYSLAGPFSGFLLLTVRVYTRRDPDAQRNLVQLAFISLVVPLVWIVGVSLGRPETVLTSTFKFAVMEIPLVFLFLVSLLLAFRSRNDEHKNRRDIAN